MSIGGTYRFEAAEGWGKRSDSALDNALEMVLAGHRLGLDVTLTTEHTAEFRHGGNVNKAHVTTYKVVVTKALKPKDAI